MRARAPTSRGFFKFRLSMFDSVWAVFAPLVALYFRDAQILSWDSAPDMAIYIGWSVIVSLISFSAFRIHDGMSHYFSVHDAVAVSKAVVVAALLTYVGMFAITRLDGIPRSLPLVHALVLAAGLIAARTFARIIESEKSFAPPVNDSAVEHIIMLGSNRLSSLYMKFLEAYSPDQHRVMAVLDDRPAMFGRAMEGVQVVGPTQHLEPVVNEFRQHGVRIDRVIAGGDAEMFAPEELADIQRFCAELDIRVEFVTDLVGLNRPATAMAPIVERQPEPAIRLPSYFVIKRFIDFGAAVVILLLSAPLWVIVGALALLDVGSPIMYWQQRLGWAGRTFMLHKVRTLQPPYDWKGEPIPEEQRLSFIGQALRRLRLDELPQLLNILVGDMSLIGPRPLLPQDQPANPTVRLMVRPGITGWAQVNGGTLLTPQEKDSLDEWYIRNASLWLDLRIVVLTLLFMVRGQRRSEQAIADATRNRAIEPSLNFNLEPAE